MARKLVPVPIVKIDDAMYAESARTDGRVGLLCTTRSTLEPSRSLLAEHVAASGTRVEVQPVLVDGAFAHLAEPLARRTGKPVFASPDWMVRDVVARVVAA